MAISSGIRCPSCQGPLHPVALACDGCHLNIEGQFQQNEFAALGQEDLHLLRIFVHTEGRIRDMEAALGVSYPTIKNKLAALRATLGLDIDPDATAPTESSASPIGSPTAPIAPPREPDRPRSESNVGTPSPHPSVEQTSGAASRSESGRGRPGSLVARAEDRSTEDVSSLLDALESGQIDPDEVIARLRHKRK